MRLRINHKNKRTEVALLDGRKNISAEFIEDANTLSEKLLPAIDRLLQENKINISDIEKVETESDLPDSYTSTRIIESVARGLNL